MTIGAPSRAAVGKRRGVGSTIKCQVRGAAAVEQVALGLLIAMLVVAGVGAPAGAPPSDSARELGGTIARRIACAPRHPVPCGRNPLALAYGFAGKLVRYLAPLLDALAEEDCCRLTTAAAGWRAAPRPGPGRG